MIQLVLNKTKRHRFAEGDCFDVVIKITWRLQTNLCKSCKSLL